MKKLLIIIFTIIAILLPIRSNATPLSDALIKYEQIAENGGWDKVISNKKIQLGDQDDRIISLWSRLYISGDVTEAYSGIFDRALEEAVKRFQTRHGLKIDGTVGKDTLKELNIPIEERIRQIKLNINKNIKFKDGLIINIPDFKLNIVENGQVIKSIKVIVGKKKRPTPTISQKITCVELNPYWNIPHRIAVKEILPKIKKNPEYLIINNIRVFENWLPGAKELDPKFVDWSVITKENFTYKLRQDPGVSNSLGIIKFIFPNEFSIYLHDTNRRELFDENERMFSHGCVRVDKPIELALYLLRDNFKWDFKRLVDVFERGKTKVILLQNPIDIRIVYWTAWVDQNDIVNFRNDIYGLDK